MVAGHLREKSGYYYAVLNYTDALGKRKTKWIKTGLVVKGNKKKAHGNSIYFFGKIISSKT